jgi:protein-L-isoaspartate(D-aspartate) O-methyltransferase
MHVLEIGAGTGYNAALLAELTGDSSLVTTIDIQPDVVEQTRRSLARAGYGGVRVLCRDGFEGAPEAAPFDRIVATVGCPDLSPRWADQLAPGGFLLIPLRHAGANPLLRVWRHPATTASALVGAVASFSGFMAMQGALADPAYYDVTRPPPAAGEGEIERPLRPELGTGPLGFWFYLGVCDPRMRVFRWLSSFGLKDERTGKTARIEGLRLVGDPILLGELDARYGEWRALGAPEMRRWRLRFVPSAAAVRGRDQPTGSAGRAWTVEGAYYRRTFTLSPPDRANATMASNGGA